MSSRTVRPPRPRPAGVPGSVASRLVVIAAMVGGGVAVAAFVPAKLFPGDPGAAARLGPPSATEVGVNLFGLQTYNHEQVFANLLTQSEWFGSRGEGWAPMPASRLNARGWVRVLGPGEFATRPLFVPPTPGTMSVRCTFDGRGRLSTGGAATLTRQEDGVAHLRIAATGAENEGAWLQLDATDPADPVRDLDCRDIAVPRDRVFDAAFVASLQGFAAVRFLDWQRVNDNPASRWATRARPDDGSQAGPGGVAVEHMVRLANEAQVDPWFIMPYAADDAYIAGFARYVHDHLAPDRTAYVELGNEVWNDMFAASQQARAEGVAARLAPPDDPYRAQMRRYAQKTRAAMRIWTQVFADRPGRLVRVAAAHNAYPDTAEMILGFEEVARWTDALATAPYIYLDLDGRGVGDLDAIYAGMDAAIDETLDFAVRNRAIAARYGKRFIAYEGGQHLVTRDLPLARLIQRDPRMEGVYARYLDRWRTRLGDRIMLYASTASIGEHGSWGLREYAGQPLADAPKARAVRRFLLGAR